MQKNKRVQQRVAEQIENIEPSNVDQDTYISDESMDHEEITENLEDTDKITEGQITQMNLTTSNIVG